MGWIQDRPAKFQAICVVLLIAVFLLLEWRFPNLQEAWVSADNDQNRQAIYLGTLGAAAIVSGFSGVVSVFGLTSESKRFVAFRVQAGEALRSNWSNVVAAGLLAMGFALAAAIVDSIISPRLATGLFVLSCWFLFENAVRTVWLMKRLINVTSDSDETTYAEENF